MSLTEIHRPTTEPPGPGTTLRVTVLGVVSPLADGEAMRELIESIGAEVDELAPRGDVARRFDVRCADVAQEREVFDRLAAGDEFGHVLVEDVRAQPVQAPAHPITDDLSWSHLPGTLRTQLHETARHH